MNHVAIQAGLDRTKHPCRFCGRVLRKPNLSTHEPACSPEGREAKRLRHIEFSRRYRESHFPKRDQTFRGWTVPDTYLSRPSDLVPCPSCNGVKTTYAVMCVACRIKAGKRRRPLAERFWEKVDRSGGPGSCWPFGGSRSGKGYGRLSVPGTHGETASRVAYRMSVGELGDLQVPHKCDNPPCCNPDHLFLGTPLDNMRDMAAKGRGRWQKTG